MANAKNVRQQQHVDKNPNERPGESTQVDSILVPSEFAEELWRRQPQTLGHWLN